MQKHSVSGNSGTAAGGSAVDAMTALTAAVQELQAAMSALAGTLNQPGTDTPPHLALPTPSVLDPLSGAPGNLGRGIDASALSRLFESLTSRTHICTGRWIEPSSLPFGASNMFAIEEQRAALDERERQRLRPGTAKQLRAAGELSADERISI